MCLLLDSPWCEIKPSHASYQYVQTKFASRKKEKHDLQSLVKGRNEPCNLIQILEVLAAIKKIDMEQLGDQIYANTQSLFFANTQL